MFSFAVYTLEVYRLRIFDDFPDCIAKLDFFG
jgi:hypothetical protein